LGHNPPNLADSSKTQPFVGTPAKRQKPPFRDSFFVKNWKLFPTRFEGGTTIFMQLVACKKRRHSTGKEGGSL
jgi:hypothetical protein